MQTPQSTDTGRGQRACVCVYGLPGTGKTRLAGSSEKPTLLLHPPTDHVDSIPAGGNCDHIELQDHRDMTDAFQGLQQRGDEFKKYEDGWVWLDGITLMEEYGMDDVFGAVIQRKPHRAEHGPDKGEYGVNRQRLQKWVRDMIGLCKAGQFNLGITSHVMAVENPVTNEDIWVPQFGDTKGKLAFKLAGYMNIVAYYAAAEKDGKITRKLAVDQEGFIGKDQYNIFPRLKSGVHGIVNPTMSDVDELLAQVQKPATRTRKRRSTAKGKAPAKRTRRTRAKS